MDLTGFPKPVRSMYNNPMSGETILVVDDEAKIVKTVRAYLENAGFRVAVAGDGQAALTAFRHERPALVVLDLGLPGIEGLDVARTLRKESSVPIIMLTARVDGTDRLVGLELGADDYVTSRSVRASWWPGCGRCCAGQAASGNRHRRRSWPARSRSTWSGGS